jgi:hypothetical protein
MRDDEIGSSSASTYGDDGSGVDDVSLPSALKVMPKPANYS